MEFKVKDKRFAQYLQEGGAMPAEAPAETAPAPEQGGGSPEEQLLMACQQALETQDCQIAMQVCQAVMQMVGGAAAPQQTAPEGEPVYRKGGQLKYWKK